MYKYFADNCVNYAVIECGMGGKGDATNVCYHSVVSVITSVALDHTDYLGDTIEKIATEKAGLLNRILFAFYILMQIVNPFLKRCAMMLMQN